MELWDAFVEDYKEEIHEPPWFWTVRFMLKAFWHYCQDGKKGTDSIIKAEPELLRTAWKGLKEREIENRLWE